MPGNAGPALTWIPGLSLRGLPAQGAWICTGLPNSVIVPGAMTR